MIRTQDLKKAFDTVRQLFTVYTHLKIKMKTWKSASIEMSLVLFTGSTACLHFLRVMRAR